MLDPVTEVLSAMRVRSAIYFRLDATAPWGVDFRGPAHAKFGMVVRGSCWLSVAGEERPLALRAGDCFLVASDATFALRDARNTRAVPCSELVARKVGNVVEHGGGGPATSVVCGWFELDAWGSTPLVDLLPRVLCVATDGAEATALRATLDLLAAETSTPGVGSPIVVSRLADLVLVQMIRAHHAAGRGNELRWLGALADVRLGPALRAMHADLERPWSVESLAELAGMSRSAFALRFREHVGEAPLAYLTRWRLYKAGCLLRSTQEGLASIADRVGYASVGAFVRAFRRAHGQSPTEFRRSA
ncbi:AraC family transcriptional regulator [Sandaracinus amylolyticus]|uniref:AraC family transcriptional regulator n=1 Tax=Sandaracinus amylolyticus TaxID=927083 RepID=UPI001F1E32D4|nr:AraC family transcriptional regulator [Sandaracinus amylolyticus]UJR81379.1 RCS-specific HTH-type transcriptional activator RclR [Sandaracinus amylolyticus]